jgi:lipase chaperone LimK
METSPYQRTASDIRNWTNNYFEKDSNLLKIDYLVSRTVFNEIDPEKMTLNIAKIYLQSGAQYFKNMYESSQDSIDFDNWDRFAKALKKLNGRSDIQDAVDFFEDEANFNEKLENERSTDTPTQFFGVFDLLLGFEGRKEILNRTNENLSTVARMLVTEEKLETLI